MKTWRVWSAYFETQPLGPASAFQSSPMTLLIVVLWYFTSSTMPLPPTSLDFWVYGTVAVETESAPYINEIYCQAARNAIVPNRLKVKYSWSEDSEFRSEITKECHKKDTPVLYDQALADSFGDRFK